MDLDRRVSEVLGARFGGGGAAGEEPIRLQLVSEHTHTHTYTQFRFVLVATDDLFFYRSVCLFGSGAEGSDGTFLPDQVGLRFPGNGDDLHQQATSSLTDQRDDLPVAHFHHVGAVHLDHRRTDRQVSTSPPQHTARGSHTRAAAVTSIRKSPVRSPALQATPPWSTDSRY